MYVVRPKWSSFHRHIPQYTVTFTAMKQFRKMKYTHQMNGINRIRIWTGFQHDGTKKEADSIHACIDHDKSKSMNGAADSYTLHSILLIAIFYELYTLTENQPLIRSWSLIVCCMRANDHLVLLFLNMKHGRSWTNKKTVKTK